MNKNLKINGDDFLYLGRTFISQGQKRFAEQVIMVLDNESLNDLEKIDHLKDVSKNLLKDKKCEKIIMKAGFDITKMYIKIWKDLVNKIKERNFPKTDNLKPIDPLGKMTHKLQEMGLDATQDGNFIVITPQNKGN